jgi:hypothetical protein
MGFPRHSAGTVFDISVRPRVFLYQTAPSLAGFVCVEWTNSWSDKRVKARCLMTERTAAAAAAERRGSASFV